MSRGWLGDASLRCIPGLTSVPFFGAALRAAPRRQRRDRIRVEQSVPVPLLVIEPLHKAVMSFRRVEPRRDGTATLPLDTGREGGRCGERSFQRSLTPELRRTRLSARTPAGSSRGCGERGPRFPQALGHAANHRSQKEVGRDATVDDARDMAAVALALPVAAGALSGGLSPKQLGDAGWTRPRRWRLRPPISHLRLQAAPSRREER